MSAAVALVIAVLVGSVLADNNGTSSTEMIMAAGTMADAGTLFSTAFTTTTVCPNESPASTQGPSYHTTVLTTDVLTVTSCSSSCGPEITRSMPSSIQSSEQSAPSISATTTITIVPATVQLVTRKSTSIGTTTKFIPMSIPVTIKGSMTYYSTWLSVSSGLVTTVFITTVKQTIPATQTGSCVEGMVCVTVTANTSTATLMPIVSIVAGTNTPYSPGFRPTWTIGHGPAVHALPSGTSSAAMAPGTVYTTAVGATGSELRHASAARTGTPSQPT